MKKLFFYIAIATITLSSCKKETCEDAACWWCNACADEPTPIASGDISDFSWTKYNSVRESCSYIERVVKSGYFSNTTPYFEHTGDTLKVCGWLYDGSNTVLDYAGNWICAEERYASGYEPYPPMSRFGEGIVLENLYMTLNRLYPNYREFKENKCYVTGIVKYYTYVGQYDNISCEWLRVALHVTDIYFEEDEK